MPTRATTSPLPEGIEKEGHDPAHRPTRDRVGREAGTAQRWEVERTLAWLNCYRKPSVRYERRADIHEASLHLGHSLVCLNCLR